MGIQINGNTNNINAGIGSLSIEDLNELDIVGVATAANFKTGVSNLHNVGLTLSGGQIDVGSNIKIGTAGVITATSFVGSGANLTGITQTTINNNADNRVITGSGTANTLEGESGLTYSSNNLYVTNSIILPDDGTTHYGVADTAFVRGKDSTDGYLKLGTNGGERVRITAGGHVNIGTSELDQTVSGRLLNVYGGQIRVRQTSSGNTLEAFGHTTSGQSYGLLVNAGTTANDYAATFRNSGGTTMFRVRGDGSIRVGDNSSFSGHAAASNLVVGTTSGSNGMTILTGSATGNIFFNDGSGNDGVVQYVHSSDPNYMRIASSGHVRFDVAAISISDDNIAPTAGDMSSGASFGTPRLHMRGDGSQSGAYELMARFQSGQDANDSGATIVLNHSNDRGLALQGGRGQSNRSFGAIKSIDNLGRLSDCIDYLGGNGQGVNYLRFFTGESTTTTERFRIGSSGQFGIAGANYGTSGQVLTSQGSSSAPQWATPSSGVSMVDEWRLSTNLTNGGSEAYITSNWVRNSTNGFSGGVGVIGGAIGSAMSVSSGYFSFPSTGIYKVEFNINYSINDADTKYFEANIIGTKNNSTYTVLARSYGPPIHSNVHNEPMYGHAYTAVIFDVTNTSNCKFRLNYSCQTSSNTIIGGGYNATHVTVTRLGDT